MKKSSVSYYLHSSDFCKMSIDINWDSLTEEDHANFNSKIRQFLDDQFKKISLPPYIKDVSVENFTLGHLPPEITIRHIGDPFKEFYDDEDDDDSQSDAESANANSQQNSRLNNGRPMSRQDSTSVASSISEQLPPYPYPAGINDLRPTSPSILGLGPAGAIGTMSHTNPMLSVTGVGNPYKNFSTPFMPGVRTPLHTRMNTPSNMDEDLRTARNNQNPYFNSDYTIRSQNQNEQAESNNDIENNEDNQEKMNRSDDVQVILEICYKGDMKLELTALLLLNYPSPSFMQLPVKLRVTGVEIRSMAVLAYTKTPVSPSSSDNEDNNPESGDSPEYSKQFHFSFLCDIDVAGDGSAPPKKDRIDIIKSMHIESEIGDYQGHGSVLRNVGNVEKFLVEKIRSIIRDELAWPGWITFEV